MTAVETAYVDYRSFETSPDQLSVIEPSITFVPAGSHLIAPHAQGAAPTTEKAGKNAVNFYGDATSYSVSTRSETGTVFGVLVDKSQGLMICVATTRGGKTFQW